MANFKRVYELTFGKSLTEGRSFTSLNIEFEIDKTVAGDSNTATIKVYNLSNESIDLLRQKDTVVFLKAGYEESLNDLIFSGKVVAVESEITKGNVVTEISAVDGLQLKEAASSRRFPKDTSLKDVFETIAKEDLGLSLGEIRLNEFDKQFKNGFIALGKTKRILDELAESHHLNWSIQDNQLVIIPKNTISLTASFRLNKDSGMIGIPKYLEGNPSTTDEEEPTKGIKVRSLLNPFFLPNKSVIVESESYNKGVPTRLKIQKVTHVGQYEGTIWVSDLELMEHKNKEKPNE